MITAQSIGPGVHDINMNGFCYTSQSRLQNVAASDNNKTISACHRVDENSERVIDHDTIVLTTRELIHIIVFTIQCKPRVYLRILLCRHC